MQEFQQLRTSRRTSLKSQNLGFQWNAEAKSHHHSSPNGLNNGKKKRGKKYKMYSSVSSIHLPVFLKEGEGGTGGSTENLPLAPATLLTFQKIQFHLLCLYFLTLFHTGHPHLHLHHRCSSHLVSGIRTLRS